MYDKELIALTDCGARYIVVGAIALSLHNYPRFTADLDILPAMDSENLDLIMASLENLGYRPFLPVNARDLLEPRKREEWINEKNMKVFTWITNTTPPDAVDLMICSPISYEKCLARKKDIELEGRVIHVACVEDLLLMKKSAMRAKDLPDIPILEKMAEIRKNER